VLNKIRVLKAQIKIRVLKAQIRGSVNGWTTHFDTQFFENVT